MVDINLFKDEEEDELEQKPDQNMDIPSNDEPENSPENGLPDDGLADHDLEAEGLGDALDFEEDLGGFGEEGAVLDLGDDDILSDEDLLDDDFSEMDEESETVDDISDYEYGDVQKKKTPMWIWALVGLIVIIVCVYLFVIQPQMIQSNIVKVQQPGGNTNIPAVLPDSTKEGSLTSEEMADRQDSLNTQTQELGTPVNSEPVRSESTSPVVDGFGSKAVYASASNRIVNELSATGQFVAILLSGVNFAAVQYVSETPNVAKAMEHKIATLIGLKNIKLSPEERLRTAGKIHYFGVVSGTLPEGTAQPVTAAGYSSFGGFSQDINVLIRKHGVKLTDIQKLVEKSVSGKKQTDIRVKIEGTKAAMVNFVQDIGKIKYNSYIIKLFLTSSKYADFKATGLKLVLEFRLIT